MLGLYVVFYGGYSKRTKTLDAAQVKALVTGERGLRGTLREWNKLLGLCGLTLLGVAVSSRHLAIDAGPGSAPLRLFADRVLWTGATMARLHAGYSVTCSEFVHRWTQTRATGLAMGLGVAAVSALNLVQPYDVLLLREVQRIVPGLGAALDWGQRHYAASSAAVLGVAVAHFCLMETSHKSEQEIADSGNRLGVRPIAFLALAAAGAGVAAAVGHLATRGGK